MKNLSVVVFSLLVLGLVGCGKPAPSVPTSSSHAAAEQAAIESAQAWLALVDGGNYAQSWEKAAAPFQTAVKQAEWEKTIRGVRAPLGKVVSRQVSAQQFVTSLPGAPAGEYVVIQFNTTFDNRPNAVETVTPMLDQAGQWKVSGYFIK
jgi:hypothetical protein